MVETISLFFFSDGTDGLDDVPASSPLSSLKRKIKTTTYKEEHETKKKKNKMNSSGEPLFLKPLCELNPHPRDSRISFVEEGHKYFIDGSDEGLISVTTLLKPYFTQFDPSPAIRMIMSTNVYFDDPNYMYYRLNSIQIKQLWGVIGSHAASVGSYLHLQIERYYNGLPADFTSSCLAYSFREFDRLMHGRGYVPYRTEFLVFHEEAKLAGCADMLFKNKHTGKLVLVDWKFIKKLSMKSKNKAKPPFHELDDTTLTKYAAQLSTYRYIMEIKYGFKFENAKANMLVVFYQGKNCFKEIEAPYYKRQIAHLIQNRIY